MANVQDSYGSSALYPYRYFTYSPSSGTYQDTQTITINFQLQLYDESYWNGEITGIVDAWINCYDSSGNSIGWQDITTFATITFSGKTGTASIPLSKCTSSYFTSCSYIDVGILVSVYTNVNGNTATVQVPIANSEFNTPGLFAISHLNFTAPGKPTVSYSNNKFSISWSPSSASGGSGNVSYEVVYGDSENGYGVYSTGSATSPASIARWVTPTWNDITYQFYIRATYSGRTIASEPQSYKQNAPYVSWSSKAITVSQVNNQVKVSWNAATLNNNYSSQPVKYSVSCNIKGGGDETAWTYTTTDLSLTFTPPFYNEVLFFQVYAYADNVSGGVHSTSAEATIYPPFVTTPGKPTVTLSGDKFKISWTASTGQYGAAGSSVSYRVHYYDSADVVPKSYSTYVKATKNSAEITKWVSASTTDITCSFFVVAFYDVAVSEDSAIATYTLTAQNPTITAQPSITDISPASGLSTTIKWSAATVSNQGTATIHYQYFVGPTSTYSDSYCIGETTEQTATITEANIIAKCGASFEGTCYLFVRAYWNKDGAMGGWSVPTAKTFTYTPHRTVKYYDGNGWVECIVFCYDGIDWRECIPYRYNGTGWDELSH